MPPCCEDCPPTWSSLIAAAKAEDWGTLKEIAHRMRGGTSYCAVPALDNALQDLERAVKAGDTTRILSGVGNSGGGGGAPATLAQPVSRQTVRRAIHPSPAAKRRLLHQEQVAGILPQNLRGNRRRQEGGPAAMEIEELADSLPPSVRLIPGVELIYRPYRV